MAGAKGDDTLEGSDDEVFYGINSHRKTETSSGSDGTKTLDRYGFIRNGTEPTLYVYYRMKR